MITHDRYLLCNNRTRDLDHEHIPVLNPSCGQGSELQLRILVGYGDPCLAVHSLGTLCPTNP